MRSTEHPTSDENPFGMSRPPSVGYPPAGRGSDVAWVLGWLMNPHFIDVDNLDFTNSNDVPSNKQALTKNSMCCCAAPGGGYPNDGGAP